MGTHVVALQSSITQVSLQGVLLQCRVANASPLLSESKWTEDTIAAWRGIDRNTYEHFQDKHISNVKAHLNI